MGTGCGRKSQHRRAQVMAIRKGPDRQSRRITRAAVGALWGPDGIQIHQALPQPLRPRPPMAMLLHIHWAQQLLPTHPPVWYTSMMREILFFKRVSLLLLRQTTKLMVMLLISAMRLPNTVPLAKPRHRPSLGPNPSNFILSDLFWVLPIHTLKLLQRVDGQKPK